MAEARLFCTIVYGVGDGIYVCIGEDRIRPGTWSDLSWPLCVEWSQGAQLGNLNHLWVSQKVVLGLVSGYWDIKQ